MPDGAPLDHPARQGLVDSFLGLASAHALLGDDSRCEAALAGVDEHLAATTDEDDPAHCRPNLVRARLALAQDEPRSGPLLRRAGAAGRGGQPGKVPRR